MSPALFSLSITAFAFGMTEFMVIGMLPILAESFSVSIARAGWLVTAYALGITVGAPILTALTMRIPRKRLLLGIVFLFALGNVIAAMAPSYTVLMIGRILSGLMHGVFFAVSLKVSTQLVAKNKQATAIALILSGLTIALVTGVPLGTFLADSFSWRSSFWIVVGACSLSLVGIYKWIPDRIEWRIPHSIWRQFGFLAHKSMLYSYALTMICFGGPFIVYTYVTETLHTITGFSFTSISAILIIYGASVAVGNLLGGRLSDRFGVFTTLKMNIVLLTLILVIFYFTQTSPLYSVITLAFWGALSFGTVPALQYLIMKLIGHYKVQAEEVASGANIAAFNFGIAGGAYLGGVVVEAISLIWVPIAGAIVVALSYPLIRIIAKNHECEVSLKQ